MDMIRNILSAKQVGIALLSLAGGRSDSARQRFHLLSTRLALGSRARRKMHAGGWRHHPGDHCH